MTDFAARRRNMVESQVRTNRVTDPAVIDALAALPRERFLDEALRGVAYLDEDIPLGGGRYLMEPMVLARLLQALEVRSGDVALVIGAGAGYAPAALARLADTVVAVESDAALAARATALLAELTIDNVAVVEGPLAEGYAKQAPFDVILFNGSVPRLPDAILAQLADRGRLGAVVSEDGGTGRAVLATRIGGTVARRDLFDAAVPPLPGMTPDPAFRF